MHQQTIYDRVYDIENCPFCDGQPKFQMRARNACGFNCTCKKNRFIQTYFDSSILSEDRDRRIESAVQIWNEQAARKPVAPDPTIYRMLGAGEVMQIGDEGLYADGVNWRALDESDIIVGLKWVPGFHNPMRRAVASVDDSASDAPKAYFRLSKGDQIEPGDEKYEFDTGNWAKLIWGDRFIGKIVDVDTMIPIRRAREIPYETVKNGDMDV
jgi:hypothetical protein